MKELTDKEIEKLEKSGGIMKLVTKMIKKQKKKDK